MIHYSTNWMGPIATRWYKDFTESYSCGRIDIYGLDESEYWGGKSEYSVPVMKTESWNLLSDYLNDYESSELVSYEDLIQRFESDTGHKIDWWVENKVK